MEKRDINIACGKIKLGRNVIPSVKFIMSEMLSLSQQIDFSKQRGNIPSAIRLLKEELLYCDKELFFALETFFEASNPRSLKYNEGVVKE